MPVHPWTEFGWDRATDIYLAQGRKSDHIDPYEGLKPEEREKEGKIEVHVSPWGLGIICATFLVVPVVAFFPTIISFFIFFGKDPTMQGLSSFAGFLSTLIVLVGAYAGIKKYLKEKLK